MKNFSDIYTDFLTITILEWKKLLQPTKYKQLIIESLAYFVKEKRAKFLHFV